MKLSRLQTVCLVFSIIPYRAAKKFFSASLIVSELF